MICSNCHTDNPPQARFCMQCGTTLIYRCSNCQAELPAEARFCMQCGQPVEAPPAQAPIPAAPSAAPVERSESQPGARPPLAAGERRVVTILFADIAGFTEMSETMDPEQVRSLINQCFDHLVPIIEKYDGSVDKFIGDEIMALFGAPTTHEDDPVRAQHAALEMMQALADFNTRHATHLGMHAGINTGLVVAGGIGSRGRQQYSVMGDTVNLASRLEEASQRGEILVGPETYRRTAPLFEFETLPPVQVKGKAEAVQVYRLMGTRHTPGRLRGLVGLESPMVGRSAELASLLALNDALQSGQGGAALVIGEPGLGKSRLISEWHAAARHKYAQQTWAEGQCLSYGQGLAYHLLTNLLRSVVGVPAAAEEQETRLALHRLADELFGETAIEVYPYLGHLLSLHLEGEAEQRASMLDPQKLQAHYLAALRRLLSALAQRAPCVLIFEDIHWADPSSVDMLIKLLPLLDEMPLLMGFITRPDRDTPGWRLVEALQEQAGRRLTEISLQALSESDSRQLITNLLEIEALPEEVRSVILQKSEGNPFFVEEIIRMLIDREMLVQDGEHWVARQEIAQVEIPDNLQSLLLARIDRLPEDVRHTLRVASVLGRQFAVRVLEEMLRSV